MAKTNVTRKLANEMVRVIAPEALPVGPFAGGNPTIEPVEGTTEDFGIVAGALVDSVGAGAGANNESGPTEDGGAISGGNCCGPASFKKNRYNL